MVTVGYNPSTGKALWGTGGALCLGCCWEPEFATTDCCCFLDPSPSAWNSGTTYSADEMVSYSGTNYYSLQDNNTNNTPTGGAPWWASYTDCGNTNWNSFSPFGGIGKTPKYYYVSVKIVGYCEILDVRPGAPGCAQDPYWLMEYTAHAVFKLSAGTGCSWTKDSVFGTVDWEVTRNNLYSTGLNFSCSGTDDITGGDLTLSLSADPATIIGNITFNIKRGPYTPCETTSDYTSWRPTVVSYADPAVNDYSLPTINITFDKCDIEGSTSKTDSEQLERYDGSCSGTICHIESRVVDVSWRPDDCNYTDYDESTNYSVGNCVAYNGKFWSCCIANGPSTAAGVQNPSGTDTSCSGNYWKVL